MLLLFYTCCCYVVIAVYSDARLWFYAELQLVRKPEVLKKSRTDNVRIYTSRSYIS